MGPVDNVMIPPDMIVLSKNQVFLRGQVKNITVSLRVLVDDVMSIL
jgi:hypothetical protein